jgi:hypothetical protein
MSNLTFTKEQMAAEAAEAKRAKMEAEEEAAPVNEEEVSFMVSQLQDTNINKQQTDIKIKKLADNISLNTANFFSWHNINANDSTLSKMISEVSPNIKRALSIANDVVIRLKDIVLSMETHILNAPNIELEKQLIDKKFKSPLYAKFIEAKMAVMGANAIIAENQELERLKAGPNPVAATPETSEDNQAGGKIQKIRTRTRKHNKKGKNTRRNTHRNTHRNTRRNTRRRYKR